MYWEKLRMAQRMLQFVDTGREMPDKRAAGERRDDWGEIYADFARAKAEEQASRCSQCGVPFCQVHCPLHNNIPDWLLMTAEKRLEEAFALSSATNNMPEICGRICPQDRLCEGNCVIEQSGHGTVTIGSIEKYITDTAWEKGWVKPIEPAQERAESVGIIGGGPGGFAAAEQLRTKGYQVHLYDRYDRMGGLLIYGIPSFKLEKEVVERRTQRLADSGITLHSNTDIGRDISFADLRARHQSILISTGVYQPRALKAPGSGLGNIVEALDFLTCSNRKGLGDEVPRFESGAMNAQGKNVVVIGGGDTAMDCVRTAVRQGAKSVKCLYRRNRENMPGSQREVANAEEEGVEFVWQAAPEAFLGTQENAVKTVRAVRMHLGMPDATGRQSPQAIEGSAFDLPADLVIMALGFDPEDMPALFDCPELRVTNWGTLRVDHTSKMTSLDGVFGAGDIVRGASLVVWAVRDGRDAAEAMHDYMQQQAQTAARVAAE